MDSLLPAALFLAFMAALYIVSLSRWGFLERRIHANQIRRMRLRGDCAEFSEATQLRTGDAAKPPAERVPRHLSEISKN